MNKLVLEDSVLIVKESNEPVVSLGNGYGLKPSRTLVVKTVSGNTLNVLVFPKDSTIDNDKVNFLPVSEFIKNPLIANAA